MSRKNKHPISKSLQFEKDTMNILSEHVLMEMFFTSSCNLLNKLKFFSVLQTIGLLSSLFGFYYSVLLLHYM